MVHYRTKKWVSENSFTKIRTKSDTEMVSFGSHWPSEVAWHLSSQSESGRKMPFQLGNFPFGPQKDEFYRGNFVIWGRVLIIIESKKFFSQS